MIFKHTGKPGSGPVCFACGKHVGGEMFITKSGFAQTGEKNNVLVLHPGCAVQIGMKLGRYVLAVQEIEGGLVTDQKVIVTWGEMVSGESEDASLTNENEGSEVQ